MNVKFTLSVIIWGDGKSHFAGISVDMNREKHIWYDGIARTRMEILQHDRQLSSIHWGRPLQLWYVKKAEQTPSAIQGQSKNIPPTINVIRQPISLTKLKSVLLPECTDSNGIFISSNAKKYYEVLYRV